MLPGNHHIRSTRHKTTVMQLNLFVEVGFFDYTPQHIAYLGDTNDWTYEWTFSALI
jgi:hypothetical protein